MAWTDQICSYAYSNRTDRVAQKIYCEDNVAALGNLRVAEIHV